MVWGEKYSNAINSEKYEILCIIPRPRFQPKTTMATLEQKEALQEKFDALGKDPAYRGLNSNRGLAYLLGMSETALGNLNNGASDYPDDFVGRIRWIIKNRYDEDISGQLNQEKLRKLKLEGDKLEHQKKILHGNVIHKDVLRRVISAFVGTVADLLDTFQRQMDVFSGRFNDLDVRMEDFYLDFRNTLSELNIEEIVEKQRDNEVKE